MRLKGVDFSLIELMIWAVILGICAAILIPNYIAMQNRTKEGRTKANMYTIQRLAEWYSAQNGGFYPNSIQQVIALVPGGKALKNEFTKNRTEPSNDTGSGCINYRFKPDSTNGRPDSTKAGHYTIHGYGTNGKKLDLVLSSDQ